jgi:polyhydroxyalkanoate synthesis repressor PhaR
MAPKPVIIKKYENRRLYDTTNSRYINQDEIARMIREGREVQVLDAATGEDLTRLVLTQIIVEDAKEPDSSLPINILREMVVASGKATQENTLRYTKALLDMYQNAYRAFAPPLSPFEFVQPRPAAPRATNGAPAQDVGAPHERELQQRVEELEALVQQLAASTGKRGKTRAKTRRKR